MSHKHEGTGSRAVISTDGRAGGPTRSIEEFVGNQQNWDTLGPERSGGWNRFGELPECMVVKSSPIYSLGLHLSSAL